MTTETEVCNDCCADKSACWCLPDLCPDCGDAPQVDSEKIACSCRIWSYEGVDPNH